MYTLFDGMVDDSGMTTPRDSAVSEVIGEMLMIGMVLILLAVFSATLPNYLPTERDPSITIKMSNDTLGNITLWHKGGDWAKTADLKVIVSNELIQVTFRDADTTHPVILVPRTNVFDLGSNITVAWGSPLDGDENVILATDRVVIFSGIVGGA